MTVSPAFIILRAFELQQEAITHAGHAYVPDYGLPPRQIANGVVDTFLYPIATLIAKLEEHGMTALGEHGDVALDVSRQVYQFAV
jgi:alcohol dehydrogenase YqhD (iron-dependent ADH family)